SVLIDSTNTNDQSGERMKQNFPCCLPQFLLIICVIVFSFSPSPSAVQAQDTAFQEGMKWFEQRASEADSFRAVPKYINNAIEAFEKAYKEGKHAEQAGLFLLKSYYFKGMFLGLDEESQKDVYDKGRDLGEKLEQKYPKSVGIKFWYSANLGRWAKVHGFMSAATSGVAKKVRNLGEEIISLDKKYQGGGGYRVLAQAYFHTPKIPLLMGWPSDKKALDLIEQAMDLAPWHPTNRLLYAEILMSFDRKEEASKHLKHIINMEPRQDYLIPDRYVKFRAGELLEQHFDV
ncbi:MAG: tetratricopeptide repeat protein, partial [Balneolaceae bacterium]|nr:tetratricopeptide repeat protein [Balneolaceae bacterium]